MNDVQQIQQNIKGFEAHVKLGETFDRLSRNPDFKAIIEDLYFRDEAVRLVSAKANPSTQSAAAQAAILKDIDAIGSLQQFFTNLVRGAAQAARELEQNQQELLIAEEDLDEQEGDA